MPPEKELTQDELWEKARQDRETQDAAEAQGEVKADAEPAKAKSEEKPAGEVVAATEKPVAEDPLAGLPDPTRKLIEGLQARQAEQDRQIKSQNQQLARANGTIGNLKQRLEERDRATDAAAQEQKRKEAEAAAAERKQKREALGAKLTDLDLGELNEFLPAEEAPAKPEGEAKPKAEAKPEAGTSAEGQPDAQKILELENALHERSPGWKQKRDSKEFAEWFKKQGADIHRMVAGWDVDESASVFEKFDQDMKAAADIARIEKERQDRLRRGETVQGRSSGSSAIDTSADGLWEQAKRDRAKAKQAAA